MPLAGLICRTCLTVTGLSAKHWEGECDEPTIDPGLLQAALDRSKQRETRDCHPEGIWFSVTELLGGVREAFLRRHAKLYTDGQAFNSTAWGTAVGEEREAGLRSLGWKTQTHVAGRLFGVNVHGTIDAHKPDWSKIQDGKAKAQGSFYFQQGRGFLASQEDSAQLNCYRLLATQMGEPASEAELEVWYGAMLAARDYKTKKPLDSWMRARASRMSEAEIAQMKCGGSLTSVAENASILLAAETRVQAGEDWRVVARDVPDSCREMFGKQKCPDYCAALHVCFGELGKDVRLVGKPRVVMPE